VRLCARGRSSTDTPAKAVSCAGAAFAFRQGMNHPSSTTVRAEDLRCHLQDLRAGTFEGCPESDGAFGRVTRFELTWPEQRAARITRGGRGPLPPVRIVVNFARGFLHPHLSGTTAGSWPFQVTSAADAERQRGVLAAIVELELHERIFQTDWRLLPVSRQQQ
jgi:hypothetical protein